MNDSIYRVSLDIQNTTSQVMLNAKKGDNKRRILFSLTDGDKPYIMSPECTAVFRARKPDGTVLYNDCDISENVIAYNLTSQTSASTGIVECEVTLYGSDGQQITSPRFSILIEDTVYSDSEIESRNEFTALNKALTAVSNINIDASKSGSKTTVTIRGKDGAEKSVNINDGARGEQGETGVGILSVGLLSTSDLTKTYRIYLSNGQTYDFTVNDGADGAEGPQGETGAKGMGILSVSLLKTEGKEKTYRIFMTDDSTTKIYDYVVTDGADGEPGETGVSVTGAAITDSGHLNITLSDGTEIDAGEIPQLVKSVNGKTGDVTLSASDVGAPSDEELSLTSQVLSLTGNDTVKIDDMFGTDYISAFLGFYAKDAVYVMITSSSSLTSGQTLTVTPVWSGIPDSAGSVDGMQLGKWYKLRHPKVGTSLKLTAVEIKTSSGWLMSPSNYLYVRYAPNTSGYELIQTITTTDSDNSYTVTPSTPLSKVYVSVEIPANTTTPNIIYQTYNGSTVLGYVGGALSSAKTSTTYLEFGTDRDENIVESWVRLAGTGVQSGGTQSKQYNPKVITTLPIDRVIFRLAGTNKFPNGLVINVYGVKVN